MSLVLDQAKHLLALIQREKILTPENTSGEECKRTLDRLSGLRNMTSEVVSRCLTPGHQAPGMTASVAVTLLKVAAGQELVQRFALEYFLQFKTTSVNLIFAFNRANTHKNHCFILLGEVIADDGLIIGRGDKPTTIAEEKFFTPLKEFLARQRREAVLADPLLDFTDAANGPCPSLFKYCHDHGITDVIGVRKYRTLSEDDAKKIKANAERVADISRQTLGTPIVFQPRAVSKVDLEKLMEKFKLDPSDLSEKAREKALRRAAMSGTTDDLTVLLSTGVKIDAQDDNPNTRNTAMHLAFQHEQWQNLLFVQGAGASIKIPNVIEGKAGKTVEQLLRDFKEKAKVG